MESAVVQLVEQAPGIGALLVVVVVFLRHIKDSERANREVMGQLRDALVALRDELKEDRLK